MQINNIPPRIFKKLFSDHFNKIYGGQLFYMETKTSGQKKTITSKFPNCLVPKQFMIEKFNKGLSWKIIDSSKTKRDIKTFDVTYHEPSGNLTIECITRWKPSGACRWQSFQGGVGEPC